ncbi:MAG: hypothetical protein AAGC54_10750 [Cyanobacteria bacterium P01_F01_bin.4]
MQLRYDAFMPRGIFWQFAVTMYRYIDNHDWVWRNGMVIQRGNTWAEVIEDLNLRRISLRFAGPSIAEFRAVIVDELDTISQAYHQLQYGKMIPCQWCRCLETADLMEVGPVEPFPPVNSFFRDRSTSAEQTEQVREFMHEYQDTPGVTVMATHFVNISAQNQLEVLGQINLQGLPAE